MGPIGFPKMSVEFTTTNLDERSSQDCVHLQYTLRRVEMDVEHKQVLLSILVKRFRDRVIEEGIRYQSGSFRTSLSDGMVWVLSEILRANKTSVEASLAL